MNRNWVTFFCKLCTLVPSSVTSRTSIFYNERYLCFISVGLACLSTFNRLIIRSSSSLYIKLEQFVTFLSSASTSFVWKTLSLLPIVQIFSVQYSCRHKVMRVAWIFPSSAIPSAGINGHHSSAVYVFFRQENFRPFWLVRILWRHSYFLAHRKRDMVYWGKIYTDILV